ncbi:MAG: Transcriptional regulator, HxlR family [Chloroflexi bacterium]|nr:Transcriptional regulator, HxlR family [Chloroflexota bacterium]
MTKKLLSGEKEQPASGQVIPEKEAVAWTARLLGDTWLLLIICELLDGTKRFGEIQEGLGKVNPQTLSGRLKVLEHCGIVTRTAYAEIPPRVEYDLTEKGYGVSEIVKSLAAFGQRYKAEIEAQMAGLSEVGSIECQDGSTP